MNFKSQIFAAALESNLDPWLLIGLISIESNFNQYAWKPEPVYRYYWDVRNKRPFRAVSAAELASEFPPSDFSCLAGDPDQEWWAQSASWGLMQIMGALARERGFIGLYLPTLCDPATNLHFGCGYLASLLTWAGNDTEQALAAYNGGKGGNETRPFRNVAYASKVLDARLRLKSTLSI